MWSGIDTIKLKRLKRLYKAKYEYDPDGSLGVEYNQEDYKDYVRDLITCIESENTELEDLYYNEDEW